MPMKKLFFLLLLFISSLALKAQYDPAKVNKKAVQLYNQAMERVDEGNLANAAGILQQAVETDKQYADAFLALAGIYAKTKSYKSSAANYEKAFAIDAEYTMDYKQMYSIQLAGMGDFEGAFKALEEQMTKKPPKNPTSLESAKRRLKSYAFAVDYAKNNPVKNYVFAPYNLGAGVNSPEPEYLPSLTIDGNILLFTRRVNGLNEDFYYSRKKNGQWEAAQPIPGPINTPMSEAGQSISTDGQWLVFCANNRENNFGNYDLYMCFRGPNGWEETYNLGGRINTDQWDAQPSLSPDKRDLYFSSRRPGGLGGKDIYVTHLQANGRWSEPENMGPGINTPGDDECPFIHADNHTFYFVSNGWPGYGGNDLFVTRKKLDGSWETPKNLGYPINTIDDEGTLFVAADGKTAYYASDRADTRGAHDIYSFELREDIRPVKTLWVQGQVTDSKTGKPVAAVVELADLSNKTVTGKVSTDENGYYLITLPVGKDYAFSVNRKGYLFYSDQFLIAQRTPDSVYRKNIALQPIELNASIVLKNIFFDVGRYELRTESLAELDKLVQLLQENPALKIEISGHTDNQGKPADNLLLSNNRAKAVVGYLVSKSVPAARLTAKGYGETQPVADNKTEEGRALNRRTEMKVTGQ